MARGGKSVNTAGNNPSFARFWSAPPPPIFWYPPPCPLFVVPAPIPPPARLFPLITFKAGRSIRGYNLPPPLCAPPPSPPFSPRRYFELSPLTAVHPFRTSSRVRTFTPPLYPPYPLYPVPPPLPRFIPPSPPRISSPPFPSYIPASPPPPVSRSRRLPSPYSAPRSPLFVQ